MSARSRPARKSTASTLSYAEPASSGDEDEDDGFSESAARGGGGRKGKSKASTQRSKAKGKAAEVDSGDEGDEDEQPHKKARTPRKAKQSKQKKGQGKLEVLNTLPVEMITEIFSHLNTTDLLALSMVNKQYRALLTAKSSARLWKAARDKLKLPDVVTEHFSEVHYAALVFGRNCQVCKAGKYVSLEPRLRLRICKSCRNQQIVKLSALERTHPEVLYKLHPRAQEVVLESRGYVLLNDLYRATVILRDLENQDEDDFIAEGNVAPLVPPSPPPTTTSRRRSSRTHSSTTWTPRYKDESDSEDDSTSLFTRRVNEYVVARSALFKEIGEHARSVAQAYKAVKKHRQQLEYESSQARYEASRAGELSEKIMSLGLGYTWCSFGASWYRSKLVKSTDPLTNDEWQRIKPELLALLDRNDERLRKENTRYLDERAQRLRQRDLRPRYDKLLESMPRSARPFAPLYLDFLVLPSVKPLWMGDGDLSDQTWLDALDGIKDEIEQFSLDLIAHAHALVLETTTDPADDPRALADDELPADLDTFFSLATSFVCCDIKWCQPPWKYDGWHWVSGRKLTDEYRNFKSIGPLVSVLEHLHEHHNSSDAIYELKASESPPNFNITLPLEVACAVTAILEVNQLDPSTAGAAELERAEKGVRDYVWDNHRPTRRNFSGERAWYDLLLAVKKEGKKLARLKPPVYLDPPVVVMHPVPGYRAPAAANGQLE